MGGATKTHSPYWYPATPTIYHIQILVLKQITVELPPDSAFYEADPE